jgi:hypothetical protein
MHDFRHISVKKSHMSIDFNFILFIFKELKLFRPNYSKISSKNAII